ncbi:MAG: GGDEF domain-containing protein [Telmatospirillum sp.]|nr:GGDEF domain-containing protein [Telmatospirillum sp.]
MKPAIPRLTSALGNVMLFGLIRKIDRPGEYQAARIIGFSTIIAVATIWLIAWVMLIETRAQAISTKKADIERMTRVVEEQTRNQFELIELFLDMIVSHYQQHYALDPRTDLELADFVNQLTRGLGDSIHVLLVDREGKAYHIGDPDARPVANLAGQDIITAQADPEKRGFFVGRPYFDPVTGLWSLPTSIALPAGTGGISTVVAAIPLVGPEPLFEAGRPKPYGSIALFSRDGTLLARAPVDREIVGRSFEQNEMWRDHLPRQSRGVIETSDPSRPSTEELLSYAALDGFPLVVAVTTPVTDVLTEWRHFVGMILRGGALLTTVALFLAHHLIYRIGQLCQTRNELEKMAQTDSLTGLSNRRQFREKATVELARLSRNRSCLSLLSLDLDHFKAINDNFGHAAGDAALVHFSNVLRSSLRISDIAARIGGEEFTILLPDTTPSNAWILAERIRRAVASVPVYHNDDKIQVTVSIGVTGTSDASTPLDRLLEKADKALYQAKETGRNRSVVHDDMVEENTLRNAD